MNRYLCTHWKNHPFYVKAENEQEGLRKAVKYWGLNVPHTVEIKLVEENVEC